MEFLHQIWTTASSWSNLSENTKNSNLTSPDLCLISGATSHMKSQWISFEKSVIYFSMPWIWYFTANLAKWPIGESRLKWPGQQIRPPCTNQATGSEKIKNFLQKETSFNNNNHRHNDVGSKCSATKLIALTFFINMRQFLM